MLHAQPVLGRGFAPSDELPGADPVLVIAYGVWQERYAHSSAVIGRKVRVNGKPATIIGVMPNGFRFPTGVDLWMPLVPTPDLLKRDNRPLLPYAILKPGVSLSQAQAELDAIAARLARQYSEDKDTGASVLTFQERFNGGPIRINLPAHAWCGGICSPHSLRRCLQHDAEPRARPPARNGHPLRPWRFALAHDTPVAHREPFAQRRRRNSRPRTWQLSASAGSIESTVQIRPYWIQFTPDYAVLGYFAALCILSAVLFGTLPALRSSRPNLNQIMTEGARGFNRRHGGWLSSVLVVFQFALTVVLLTGAGLFLKSLFTGLAVNSFIPAKQLWTARLELPDTHYKDAEARERFYDQLLPRLRALPGVTSASIASDPPGLGSWRHQIEIEAILFPKRRNVHGPR